MEITKEELEQLVFNGMTEAIVYSHQDCDFSKLKCSFLAKKIVKDFIKDKE